MISMPDDGHREKLNFSQHVVHGKVIANHWRIVSLVIAAISLLCGFEMHHNSSVPQSQPRSRARADEVLGRAAVEAASAGDYDAADDFLNYIHSDAICDDYSEDAALQLLTLGKSSAATAIAYKIEGVDRRDRLLEQIECEAEMYTEIQDEEYR